MGYVNHHTVVVASWYEKMLREAHHQAATLALSVSNVVESPVNGYWSFFAAPDGSKEGWGASDVGDASRDAFIRWLNDQRAADWSALDGLLLAAKDIGHTRGAHPAARRARKETPTP